MHRILPIFFLAAACGCASGLGQSLGLGGPEYKLLPEAKAFRMPLPAASEPRELAKIRLATHIIEPGDVLLVQPVDLDSPVRLPPDQLVLPDGSIDLGVYGHPVVSGKTVSEIELQLQNLVNAKDKPKDAKPDPEKEKETNRITVRLISRTSAVYYVFGEVNAPGSFPVIGRETVLDAIVAAGGLTKQAAEKDIVLSRPSPPDGCRTVLPVCWPQIVQLGDTSTNYQIRPGDRIYVPSEGSTSLRGILCRKQPECGPCTTPQFPCPREGCAK